MSWISVPKAVGLNGGSGQLLANNKTGRTLKMRPV